MSLHVRTYYYHHAESDSLWSSNRDFDEEGNPDGCTFPISRKRARELKKELKMQAIPHYKH